MNSSDRKLRIFLSLGGIGLLISFVLGQTELANYGWMPLLLMTLTMISILLLVAGLLIAITKQGHFILNRSLSVLRLKLAIR